MQTVIYADVLVVLNLIITYLLLLCSALVLHLSPSALRLFFGSLLGGLSSLVILLPDLGWFVSLVLKAGICFLITAVSFRSASVGAFFRHAAVFLLCSIGFAGVTFALICLFSPSGIAMNNGTLYVDLDFLSLVLTAFGSFLAVSLTNRFFHRKKIEEELVSLTIEVEGKRFTCLALYDSGNRLSDPAFGSPVSVVAFNAIQSFLPYELHPFFSGNIFDVYDLNPHWSGRIRFLPAETASGESLLPCFRADRAYVKTQQAVYVTERALIGVTTKGFQHTDYSALVGPDMFLEKDKGGQNEENQKQMDASKTAADVSRFHLPMETQSLHHVRYRLHQRFAVASAAAREGEGRRLRQTGSGRGAQRKGSADHP